MEHHHSRTWLSEQENSADLMHSLGFPAVVATALTFLTYSRTQKHGIFFCLTPNIIFQSISLLKSIYLQWQSLHCSNTICNQLLFCCIKYISMVLMNVFHFCRGSGGHIFWTVLHICTSWCCLSSTWTHGVILCLWTKPANTCIHLWL